MWILGGGALSVVFCFLVGCEMVPLDDVSSPRLNAFRVWLAQVCFAFEEATYPSDLVKVCAGFDGVEPPRGHGHDLTVTFRCAIAAIAAH